MSATTVEPLAASEPVTLPGIRDALVRAALTALLIAVSLVTYVKLGWPSERIGRLAGLFGLPALAVGPVHLVERAAARRAPSLTRDALLALAAWIVGSAGILAALVQLGLLNEVLARREPLTLASAAHVVGEALEALDRPGNALALLALAAPAAATAVARVRRLDRGPVRLFLVGCAGALLATAPLLGSSLADPRFFPLVFIPAFLTPLAAHLASPES